MKAWDCTAAVDCTGSLFRPHQWHSFTYLLSDLGALFFGPPVPEYIHGTKHRPSRSLAGCRSRDTASTPAIHERTGRLDGIQNRSGGAQRHCCRLFLSETNGLREGARACGHPIPSQPGPDPTWGEGRGGMGGRRRSPSSWFLESLGGPHPHLVPISQPLSHCTVQPTVPLPFQQGPPSRARSSVLV